MTDKSVSPDATCFPVITWNIEGWTRNCLNLLSFVEQFSPVFVFLTEPQIFQCDVASSFTMFQPSFSFHLNSEDLFCRELPLVSRRAAGGTMAIWKAELDPFVRILPTTSAAVPTAIHLQE